MAVLLPCRAVRVQQPCNQRYSTLLRLGKSVTLPLNCEGESAFTAPHGPVRNSMGGADAALLKLAATLLSPVSLLERVVLLSGTY